MLKYVVVVLIFAIGPTALAQSRYGSWQQEPDKAETLAKELNRLVDEAARARAADPRFLQDLRNLANRYVNPWPLLIVQDNFQDGDIQSNPRWVIVGGNFELPYGGGLRSLATAQAAPAPQTQTQRREAKPEELAAALLGQILNQGRTAPRRQDPPPAQIIPAEIRLPQTFSNAFSLQADFRADTITGNVALAVYQGQSQAYGYQLTHSPVNGLVLERRGASGVFALAAVSPGYKQKVDHKLVWTRSQNGDMVVSLDGREVIRVNDQSFKRNWDGLAFRNDGGDVTLDSIQIYGPSG